MHRGHRRGRAQISRGHTALPGLVMNHPPLAVFLNKSIGRDQNRGVDDLCTNDQRHVGRQQNRAVGDSDRWWVLKNRLPAFQNRFTGDQRRPTGMDTGDRSPLSPQRFHAVKITACEGVVEGLVSGQHVLFNHSQLSPVFPS